MDRGKISDPSGSYDLQRCAEGLCRHSDPGTPSLNWGGPLGPPGPTASREEGTCAVTVGLPLLTRLELRLQAQRAAKIITVLPFWNPRLLTRHGEPSVGVPLGHSHGQHCLLSLASEPVHRLYPEHSLSPLLQADSYCHPGISWYINFCRKSSWHLLHSLACVSHCTFFLSFFF